MDRWNVTLKGHCSAGSTSVSPDSRPAGGSTVISETMQLTDKPRWSDLITSFAENVGLMFEIQPAAIF